MKEELQKLIYIDNKKHKNWQNF